MIVKRVLALIILLLAACQNVPDKLDKLIDCPEARSPMCTKIYRPVCGQDKEGKLKTYASDCTACANVDVVGYQEGVCTGETK